MKILIDEDVYNIPQDLLSIWIHITPSFRERFTSMWLAYRREYRADSDLPTHEELEKLIEGFNRDKKSELLQLFFDVAMDFRNSAPRDFEEYKIEMSADELVKTAESEGHPTLVPEINQPIKIDVNSDKKNKTPMHPKEDETIH